MVKERLEKYKAAQKPLWDLLLQLAIRHKVTKKGETTLNNRGTIPLATLKAWCQKRELYLGAAKRQIQFANILLGHFGSTREIAEYEAEESSDEEDEEE